MDLNEYIIRVVLKATNEISATLKDAAEKFEKLDAAQKKASTSSHTHTTASKAEAAALTQTHVAATKLTGTYGKLETAMTKARGSMRTMRNDWNLMMADMKRGFDTMEKGAAQISKSWKFPALLGGIQILSTGITGLIGELTALAAVAVQAGAALGGAFAAGIAQAGVAAPVLIEAMSRLKLVTAAVALEHKAATETALQHAQASRAVTSSIHAEQDAAFGLSQSYVSLQLAARGLTEARREALRSIQDLNRAEIEAVTASQNASLAYDAARQNLENLSNSGANLQDIAQAQNDVASAGQRLTDSHTASARAQVDANIARQRGVNGSTSVISATQGQAAAVHALHDAQIALNDAQTQAAVTAQTADAAASAYRDALAKLTPVEQKAAKQLQNLRDDFTKAALPAADKVVAAFGRAFDRIGGMLRDPNIIRGFNRIGAAAAGAVDEFTTNLTSAKTRGLLESFQSDAAANIGRLGDIFTHGFNIFMQVAKAAQPILDSIASSLDLTSQHWDAWLNSDAGQAKLKSFFADAKLSLEAIHTFVDSLAHLIGAVLPAAADSGRKSLEQMAGTFDRWTGKVKANDSGVRQFFENARHVASELMGLVIKLIGALGSNQNMAFFDNLVKFLSNTVIPALAGASKVLGALLGDLNSLANIPIVGGLLKGLIEGGIIFVGVTRMIGLFTGLTKVIYGAVTAMRGLVTETEGVAAVNGLGIVGVGSGRGSGILGAIRGRAPIGIAGALAANVAGSQVGGATGSDISAIGTGAAAGFTVGGPIGAIVGGAAATLLKGLSGGNGAAGDKFNAGALKDVATQVKNAVSSVNGDIAKLDPAKLDALRKSISGTLNLPKQTGYDFTSKQVSALHDLSRALDPVNVHMQAIADNAKRFNDNVVHAFDELKPAAQDVRQSFQSIDTGSQNVLTNVKSTVKSNMDSIASDLGTKSAKGRQAVAENFIGAAQAIQDAINQGTVSAAKGAQAIGTIMADTVGKTHGGIAEVGRLLAHALTALGQPSSVAKALAAQPLADMQQFNSLVGNAQSGNVTAPGSGSAGALGRATGGPVPGSGSSDTVPAMLTPGEHVWTKDEVARAGGQGAMYAMRAMFGRGGQARGGGYATGGKVGALDGPAGSGDSFIALANFAKNKFGLTMTAGRTNHSFDVAGTNRPSDHSWGGAGDFSDGYDTPHEKAFNQFFKTKAPQVVKQLIFEGKDQLQGFAVSDHFDHVHLAIKQALAFDAGNMARILAHASSGLSIAGLLKSGGPSAGSGAIQAPTLNAPKVHMEGVMGVIAQQTVNAVTRAANAKLGSSANAGAVANTVGGGSSVGGSMTGHSSMTVHGDIQKYNHAYQANGGYQMDPTIVARIARWAGLPGVTFEQIAEGESSWEPGAIQKPGGAGTPNNGFGLWQITTPPANGPDMVDAVKRLGGWMQMLNPFKNARMAKWLYDRGGMSHWYGTRYWDGRVHDYNRGGGVDSVPANLTPGEHVWTADEVSNAGGQSAMYAMRQNFQSGGAVDSGSAQRASTQVTNIAGVTAALRYMASHTASATAANISSTVRQFQQVYLPSLLNALQDITNSLARWVTNSTYAFRNGALVVKRAAMTETGLAKLTVESLATQMAGATQVVTALSAQVGDLKRIVAHAKGKAKDTANAALKGTEKELEAAREAQAQVLASYADAYRALQQAQIDDINNHFSRINSKLSSQQGIAQASGNLGALPGIDDQIMASIREQMADLKKRLPGLKNNPALRRQVAEQLDGLESQLATTAAQKIQDQITIVNNRAGNAAALIGAIQTATGAQGNTGVQAGLDQAMVSVMQGQISSLQQILTTMDPNSAAAQQLQQQIWGLQAQVVSTTVKGVQDMIADTENRYNNVLSGLATQAGYVALLQQAGNPRAAAALQVSNLGAQNSALGGQRAEYMAEQYAAGLAGDQGDWQQLGQKIAALDLTIAQNTQAIHDSMANLAQSLDSLAGSIEGTQSGAVSGGVSYLQQYGKLNNVNTSAAQLALLQSGTVGLNTQRGGINGAIAALLQDPGIQQAGLSGMVGALANAQGPAVFSQIAALMSSAGINMLDPAELASLQQVVSSLETNTQGTLDNTQAIMQLNGTINQPQTFTSTLFTNYRDALFNGMGGLMPGYARALGTNVLGTVQAGSLSSNSTTGDTIVNVNLTNPTETTDPLLVGRTAAWALKTP